MTTKDPKDTKYRYNYDPNVRPNITMFILEEKYPDINNPKERCQNDAKLVTLKQNYFNCRFTDNEKPSDWMRVTEGTFKVMQEYPYYKLRSECKKVETSNKVCLCASGYTDYLCETE